MLNQSALSLGLKLGINMGINAVQTPLGDVIQSRFGEVTIDLSRAVVFPRGLLGMPDKFNFVLANFNSAKMEQFALLQSTDELPLSFITMPIDVNNSIVGSADIYEAAHSLQIKQENLLVLLVVSVHRSPDKVRLSVNARAPLFIDVERKFGTQYVFHSDSYKVQHML